MGGSREVYFLTSLALLFGFYAIMEFIFIKETKQYISTTIILIIVLVIMFNLDQFPLLD
ncbi:hypothetical protein GCM10008013_16970 [Paenibacillus segetis]|uniref:Uncharacterized protein n=1 Tax=Paenibacillus segetis TaxID=1325360 RepID=A0ABQ1YD45_9BACL|nr:hypothetical protein GCM10008013_16970 [Paenibacillus segetis]